MGLEPGQQPDHPAHGNVDTGGIGQPGFQGKRAQKTGEGIIIRETPIAQRAVSQAADDPGRDFKFGFGYNPPDARWGIAFSRR